MALHEQNKMLQILHGNGVSRNHIDRIMADLKGSGIFDEKDIPNDSDWDSVEQVDHIMLNLKDDLDWNLMEKKLSMWFDNPDSQEKSEAIKHINDEPETESDKRRTHFFYDTEKRILAKMKEMEQRGLTGTDEEVDKKRKNKKSKLVKYSITRYGRSPLHEAIAMKDIRLVKKYVREGLYLDAVDNNNHTPIEMAYYEGYEKAVHVFQSHKNKK